MNPDIVLGLMMGSIVLGATMGVVGVLIGWRLAWTDFKQVEEHYTRYHETEGADVHDVY